MLNTSAQMARLERAAVRLAEEKGLEYIDTELVKEPAGKFLRIYIDRPGGITLDELEVYHKLIRDEADDIDYDYMEVSSPGADRPLKKPRDFDRTMGQTVEVKLYTPVNGSKQYCGTLTGYDEENIRISVNDVETVFPKKSVALIRPFVDVEGELENAPEL